LAVARLATGTPAANNFVRGDGAWAQVAYGDLSGVPATFPPGAHTHSDPELLSLDWSKLLSKPTTFAPSPHSHSDPELLSLDWSKLLNKPATFPPAVHTHDAADVISGVFVVARLGTGTPDTTKYLRGDGTWAIPPGGAGGGQTPWAQNIDGAGYRLSNTGNIQIAAFGQASNTEYLAQHGLFFRAGFTPADGANEANRRNVSITTGRGTSDLGDALDINGFHHISFFTGGVERARVDGYGVLAMSNLIGERIRLWDYGSGINHAMGVEPSCFWMQAHPAGMFRWYIGTAPDGGATDLMELSASLLTLGVDLKTPAMILPGFGGICFNMRWTDTWRYLSNGAAGYLSAESDRIRFLVAGAGTTGAVASLAETFSIATYGVTANVPLVINCSGRGMVFQGVNELDIDFYINNAGTNLKRTRIMAASGFIALNTLDDAYSTITSRLELYNNKVMVSHPICVTVSSIYAPGLQGLHLGYDGNGMVAAYDQNANAWKQLYLRGQNIYIEPQGGAVAASTAVVQILPTSQSDPGGFGSNGSAHYIYFDPATKKLVLRYHEYGVAYRNYTLKEGDQTSAVLVYSDTANTQVIPPSNASYWSLKTSIDRNVVPAGTAEVRIQFSAMIAAGGAGGSVHITAGPTSYSPNNGISAPTGQMCNINNGLSANSLLEVDLRILYGSSGAADINGFMRSGGGAWNPIASIPTSFGGYQYWTIWGKSLTGQISFTTSSLKVFATPAGNTN
jgi:hypothetical protein